MKKLYFIAVLFVSQIALAQVTNEATPRGWNIALKSTPRLEVMPLVDEQALLLEDELEKQNSITKPLRFGTNLNVDFNLFNSGTWTELENGDRLWRLQIKSNGAKTMNLMLDRYDVPEGAEFYVYNNEHTDKIGPYTDSENQSDGYLMTWMIKGDHVWVEYFEPASVKNMGRISIDKVVHGYRSLDPSLDVQKLNESGDCNVDALCDPNGNRGGGSNWATVRDDYINGVARIIFPSGNGSSTCTGTLINNVAQDGTPYFLTADHCLGNTADGAGASFNASQWSFGFQWYTNTPDCATFANTVGSNAPTRVLTGATLKANRSASDFALFELNQMPPAAWDLFYGGWNKSATPSTQQLGIHHPSFDIMKLSRNDQSTFATTFQGTQTWIIADWDYGVTEGGSSGSCLLDINGHIVGQLYGGFAACSGTNDNGTADYYGRFDISWNGGFSSATRLRDWLDPANTNPTSLDGEYASTLSNEEVNTIMNIQLYPNPSRGIFNVVLENPASYGVYDLSGKLIRSGSFNQIENQLDIQNLSSGIYFLKVEDGNNSVTEKISKI